MSRRVAFGFGCVLVWLLLAVAMPSADAFQGDDEADAISDVGGFAATLVSITNAEHGAYGGLHECGSAALSRRIGEYWQDIGMNLNGCNQSVPWSAAFISAMMRAAGAGSEFRYSSAHREYIHDAFAGGRGLYGTVVDANGATAVEGDLVCSGRARVSGWSYADFQDWYASGAGDAIPTHCDIVVEVSGSTITVIGGNVGQQVKRATGPLSNYAIVLPLADPLAWEAEAFEEASAQLDDWIINHQPSFRIWPHPEAQVVLLESFLWIADEGWVQRSFASTVNTVTVTVTATPVVSYWDFKETVTGGTTRFSCAGRGDHFEPGDRDADCGHIFQHSSPLTGPVELRVSIGFELTVHSSLPDDQSNFVDCDVTDPDAESDSLLQVLIVNEVLTYGIKQDNGYSGPQTRIATTIYPESVEHRLYGEPPPPADRVANPVPDTTRTTDDPPPPGERIDDPPPPVDDPCFPPPPPTPDSPVGADQDELPVKVDRCTVWTQVGGGIFGLDGDVGGGTEILIEEYADGSKVVTVSGEGGVGAGGGATNGVGVYVNDSTIGGYFGAEAAAWATLGGGASYSLAPDETLEDFLVDYAIDQSTGLVGDGLNEAADRIFGRQPIPQVDTEAHFVTAEGRGEAAAIARGGNDLITRFIGGDVDGAASADVTAGSENTLKRYSDGRIGVIKTVYGEANGEGRAGINDGLLIDIIGNTVYPDANGSLDLVSEEVSAHIEGSVEVEVIVDSSGNPIEAIVTTAYGWDVDADLITGSESDHDLLSITSQQWTIDLTNDRAFDAFPSNPLDIPDFLDEHGQTTGPVTQQLIPDVEFTIGFASGLAGFDGAAEFNFECTTLTSVIQSEAVPPRDVIGSRPADPPEARGARDGSE